MYEWVSDCMEWANVCRVDFISVSEINALINNVHKSKIKNSPSLFLTETYKKERNVNQNEKINAKVNLTRKYKYLKSKFVC